MDYSFIMCPSCLALQDPSHPCISALTAMSAPSLPFAAGANTVEDQRARWERKRSRTAKELLETEHKYLEQLDLVLTVSISAPSGMWVSSDSTYLSVL